MAVVGVCLLELTNMARCWTETTWEVKHVFLEMTDLRSKKRKK